MRGHSICFHDHSLNHLTELVLMSGHNRICGDLIKTQKSSEKFHLIGSSVGY